MAKHRVRRIFLQCILAVILIAAAVPTMAAGIPTATTGAASAVGSTGATLNGTVNANDAETTVTFEYGLTTGYGGTFEAAQSPVSGTTDSAVSVAIYELLPNTTYHYRVKAQNIYGTAYGSDMTFTTLPNLPLAVTNAASGVGPSSATLNGTVHPMDANTTVTFEYGTDTGYGTTVTADQSPLTTNLYLPWPVSHTITGLANNTTYHYRVKATNAGGTTYGADMTFTIGTVGTAPTATTAAATGIGTTNATLNGTVNAGDSQTTVTFEYGLTTGYGLTVTADQSPVTGTTNMAVNTGIHELLPNTTYHYRVKAQNTNGTATGADMTFTTLPQVPTATTNGATAVGTASATLNGTVNANNSSTTVTFQYGTTTGYGTTVTATQSPVSGAANTAVSRAITGLSNGITYHYRVVATNAGGTTFGADMTFTTGATAPTAVTNAASGVSTTGATLNGTVNAHNSSTTVTFEYGLDTSYGRSVSANPDTVTGSANTAVNAALTDLLPTTTYHYRVKATSAGGTTFGADMTFTTLAAPTVITTGATAVTTTGATLNGTVNANGSSTTVTFQYGTTTGYGTTVTADQSPVTGATNTAVSKALTGLTPNTTYHYRVVGQNGSGTTYGADMTFYTGAATAPTATTNAAAFVLSTGATLNGTVNANNASTTVTFEYGTTTGYGTTVPAVPGTVTGAVNTPVAAVITGLTANTTYHYRVVATNANGTANGADMTFTTSYAPSAVTEAATGVGGSFATLNGTVNANGFFADVTFEYGTSTSYGTTVPTFPIGVTGSANTPVSTNIAGLINNTTYHYRVVAVGLLGTSYGADMTFTTTTSPTAVTNAATAVGGTSATLNGTVNARGAGTTVTFEFGETTGYGRVVTADQSPVSGSTDTAVSVNANALFPNTTYHYRVVAQNVNDTVYGADMTFTTSGIPPSATTGAATAVTTSGATLNGTVNAQNDSTTVTFEYGTTTGYGTTVTADQSPVTVTADTAVSKAITGLANNTTYHYRVAAQNSSGTTYGADMTFFTGTSLPTVTTGAASNIGTTGATLSGTVNANDSSTTVTFEFGETTGYGRVATADQSPVSGSGDTAVSADITALSVNTTYHYRVVGQNAAGTSNGADMTFTTNAVGTATVTTANVTTITAVSAIGGGNVTDEGDAPVTARGVCWSTVLNPTTADSFTVDGSGAGAFTSTLTGLTPGTTYYVRAYATNLYGTVYGGQIQFTTNAANTPVVTTADVTHITETLARSGGNVIDGGSSPVTARGVCWGIAPNPTTADRHTVDGSGTGAFTSFLTGLKENTAYYVRAYATNAAGTAYGGQFTFKTAGGAFGVVITNPADGATVSGTVTISAAVTSGAAAANVEITAVSRVVFYIDGTQIAEDTAAPYKTQWDTTAYADGSHTVEAVAYDANNQSARDEITVTVNNVPPEIWVNRSAFHFASDGAHTTGAQTLLINNSGGGSLNWHIDTDEAWLSCMPTSGVGSGVVAVSVDPAGLSIGTHSANVTVSDSSAANSPVFIEVTLKIYDPGTTSTPFGYVLTPIDGLTVTGSIPVTGWVLDDIETAAVKIFRSPVAGEGESLIYLGDAVFVAGARPLMEETYPDLPLNDRAGWGYMLLTNLLPDQGNGTFKLFALAVDKEGHQVLLGTRAIAADNANAYKPFGGIDTPAQGEVTAGHAYVNSGWALTPQPYTIPANGSTITVRVDGVPLGNPVYDQYRPDIAALFPGYTNSSGAGGYFDLDTTAYENGVHTISWSAVDNGGNRDCIGIHYFSIQNIGSSPSRAAVLTNMPDMPYESHVYEADSGELSIEIKELEHVEIRLAVNPAAVTGYLDVNGALKSLPIGSTLDQDTGRFFWSPGPGFVGPYSLLFIIEGPDGQTSRKTIKILIQPKY
jgi:phosphodiesterase/alkaline phosphatase D-like protein